MKKQGVILLCIILSIMITGCGKLNENDANEQTSDMEGMKIAIVSSPSGVDDGGFNKNNYDGVLAFIAKNPECKVTAVKEPSGDVASSVQAVADIVAEQDVIVCCGYQFAGVQELALENPAVAFILVDVYPVDDFGKEVVAENIYAMKFKEQEGGFFAGIAAALETKTGKVAVVNGIAYPSNVNYQRGFERGVNYANENYGTTAEVVSLPTYAGMDAKGVNVGGNYVGDFADESTGKVVGQALIEKGCDVIFTAAGASGNGVFTAAKEAGNVFCIGCDVDQFDNGWNGDRNIILTSVLKRMDRNVEEQLNHIKNGSFHGENALLGADTNSTGYIKTEGRHQLSDDTIARLDEAFGKVKSGEVVLE